MDSALDRVFDWTSFQRLDNAAVVEFLASSAAALGELNLITRKEIDDLRVSLSSIQASSDKRGRPLLLELERENGNFLQVLLGRYGASGLALNLLRHTLSERVAETRRILADFGRVLVSRAELLFNRPAQLYSGSRVERQTIYSALLVEWAEKISESERLLAAVSDALSQMIGHGMAGSRNGDEDIDEAVAQSLGFRSVIYPVLLGQTESEIQHQLSMIFGQISRTAMLYIKQIALNFPSDSAYAALATMEWLQGEAQRLEHPDLMEGANLFAMEMRRRHLLSTLSGINGILGQLLILVTQSLTIPEKTSRSDSEKLPESLRRRLLFELIGSGANPHHATEAVHSLFDYLEDHRIHVKDVLVGELHRIHPTLTPSVLEIMVELTTEQSSQRLSFPEKNCTLDKMISLSTAFAKILSGTLMLMTVSVFSFSACGLKTNPRSDIVEFRPDIPFREFPAAKEMGPPKPEELAPGRSEKLRSL